MVMNDEEMMQYATRIAVRNHVDDISTFVKGYVCGYGEGVEDMMIERMNDEGVESLADEVEWNG